MLIAAIITGIFALACGIVWLVRIRSNEFDTKGQVLLGCGFWIVGFIWFIAFLSSMNLSWATQNLTGYIYSSETSVGYTTGHLRFSENAGVDNQPSFCAKADSPVAKQITALAGSGKKVRVTVPPYFYFSNNPFACGTTETTIKVL